MYCRLPLLTTNCEERKSEEKLLISIINNDMENFLNYCKKQENLKPLTPKLRTVWEIPIVSKNEIAFETLRGPLGEILA